MMHPTPIEIAEHLRGECGAEVRSHLDECNECARTARAIKAFADRTAWQITALPDPDELAKALDHSSASQVLQRLGEAEALRHANPAEAVAICDQLLQLPECLAETEEGLHLSVLVLRERSNALRFLGRLQDARTSVARARAFAEQLLVGEFENAVLDYIEATILLEQEELDDAESLARRAERTFDLFGDAERAAKSLSLAASVEYARGDHDAARLSYLQIVESGRRMSNAMRAGLLHNLAAMEVLLERYEDARLHSELAANLYGELGMTTEITRLKWADARMAQITGDLEVAETLFTEVESEFREANLDLDAALISLELLELHESQGRRDDVVRVATRLASIFAEAGAKMSLATTLATLRDAAVRGEDLKTPILTARNTIEELMAQG